MSAAPQRIIVVDNFYADPAAVRARALREAYGSDPVYPGVRSSPIEIPPELREIFQRYIGVPVLEMSSVFQVQADEDGEKSFVHGDLTNWAAVLYLNADRDGTPGTCFFRHRETGRERMPAGPDLLFEAIERGIDPEEVMRPFCADGFDRDKWEVVLTIPMRFNRLLLYDARLFHRNATAWGQGIVGARIVQAFFIFTEPPQKSCAGVDLDALLRRPPRTSIQPA